MKAAVMHEYGGPEVLKYEDYPDPAPAADEVLIKIAAASINPIDLKQRSGETRSYNPVRFPGVIGWDVSGTVVALGPGAKRFSIGDRVFAWAYHTYATFCVAKTEILAKIPDGLDLDEAAALPLVTMTGSQLISVASGMRAGQTVLVSGAVGSVGRAAVCMAKDKGAIVIAGVQRKQLAEAKTLGAEQVVALDDDVAFNSIEPVDVVANTVGGTTAERLMSKVKKGGTFASVAGVPGNAKDYPSVRALQYVSKQDPTTLLHMAEAIRVGRLKIPVAQKLPLKDARQGHVAMEKGAGGKILLIP
jgi:NADPH:quinone reductase-like Zn-dependent oxidoreductase